MQISLAPQVLWTLDTLESAGYEAYAVGGCIRDYILGRPVREYDLCSAATPADVVRVFRGDRLIDTGAKHGTLTLVKDGLPLEITTFRSEGAYSDSRHPDTVSFGVSILEDLSRRDFTCNAMAFSPRRGLVDPFGGRRACRDKLLSAVGDAPMRFTEDALRILRAVRFASVLGFDIALGTKAGMLAQIAGIDRLSRERVAAELNKLLKGRFAARALEDNAKVIARAVPTLALLHSEDGTAWTNTLGIIANTPRHLPLRWAALTYSLGDEKASALLQGLRQPRRLVEAVALLVQNARVVFTPPALPMALSRLGAAGLLGALRLQRAQAAARGDAPGEASLLALSRRAAALVSAGTILRVVDLPVDGHDLVTLGFSPGPALGQALSRLLDMTLRGHLPATREAMLSAAEAMLTGEGQK